MALQYPGVSSITLMGVIFGFATIHPPLRFNRAGRVCDLLVFVRPHARERLVGTQNLMTRFRSSRTTPSWLKAKALQSSETEVTGVADVEIRSSDRWQGEPRRRCNVFRYGGRKHDTAPDSCTPWHSAS